MAKNVNRLLFKYLSIRSNIYYNLRMCMRINFIIVKKIFDIYCNGINNS